ncbi:hypothetical protein CCHR01_03656 [Colletotrichum chrysophilum]|uniref:Uncharacterized protein n=1 Tax=Colletotrichum chrysophilum TaxID=1836956 RepID=A0AAD9EJ55_9PEZI|nr:hypothetical protein CCHR01_03656 [Colletotrichum chrysophilum]
MSNEVDFAFQGDVINLGSLTHMMTGRVLKALSDGKVDIYAVGAAFWLGARIPIRSSVTDTVHAHVSQRRGYQSVLSKALSIGWGHSTPVVEMTRTRAGTNALLLVGALATGASPFQAAQCLSELLSVFGIDAEKLPSADFERGELRHLGSPNALAGAIKQLIYTSKNRQEHYLILDIRGSWLPAFASHFLGMSVELHCNGQLIWAAGRDKGSVVFQLGKRPMEKFSIQSSNTSQIVISSPETIQDDNLMSVDYLLTDALEAILAKRPQIDSKLVESVHGAIRRMSKHLLADMIIERRSFMTLKSTGDFDNAGALEEVLHVLQIKATDQESEETFPRRSKREEAFWTWFAKWDTGFMVADRHASPPEPSTPSSSSSSSVRNSPTKESSASPTIRPSPPTDPVPPEPVFEAEPTPEEAVTGESVPKKSLHRGERLSTKSISEEPVPAAKATPSNPVAVTDEPVPSKTLSTEESLPAKPVPSESASAKCAASSDPSCSLPNDKESFERGSTRPWRSRTYGSMGPSSHGFTFLARNEVLRLASLCELHRYDAESVADTSIDTENHVPRSVCICQQIGTIIHNTSIIALALAHCRFNSSELRIPEQSLTYSKNRHTSWCGSFIPGSGRAFGQQLFDGLLDYLAQVFCVDYSYNWKRSRNFNDSDF